MITTPDLTEASLHIASLAAEEGEEEVMDEDNTQTILLVEDNADMRKFLRACLRRILLCLRPKTAGSDLKLPGKKARI
ncbi:MAG: hypothetical protein R3B47_02940 [Bacteroidia bacterium]